MADWYVSSAAWTAIAQFAASTAYTVGQIVRQLTAPAANFQHAFRCTTAGTSGAEPSWPGGDGQTVTTGGVTFTNVTARAAYGWSAAAGNIASISYYSIFNNRPSLGDRVFVSSDHSESTAYGLIWNPSGSGFGLIQAISVNRAGSVPPVVADYLVGAAVTSSQNPMSFDSACEALWQGFTFTATGGNGIAFNQANEKTNYFKECLLVLNGGSGQQLSTLAAAKAILDNTPIQFTNAGQAFVTNYTLEVHWINTPNAIQGTVPTSLVKSTNAAGFLFTLRGVDLSALTSSLLTGGIGTNKLLLDSCKIAPGLNRYNSSSITSSTDEVELVNCYDGTNVLNERHTAAGDITADRSTYLTSGAQDDIGNYSLKLVSSSRSDFAAMPLDAFTFDVENTATGTSKTATVEIVSSASLNNNDIRLLLEYMGTSGNPIASFGDSLASVLTAASALPSSSNTWTNPPSTPVKQLLQVTFTPQRAGRVRGTVRLGKVSTTCWVNPQIAIA